jgi:hypothetical protein
MTTPFDPFDDRALLKACLSTSGQLPPAVDLCARMLCDGNGRLDPRGAYDREEASLIDQKLHDDAHVENSSPVAIARAAQFLRDILGFKRPA